MQLASPRRDRLPQPRTAIAIVAAAFVSAPALAQTSDIRGEWQTGGKAIVRIEECGKFLCGRILDFKPPRGMTKATTVDGYNPDKSKRRRKILGLQILTGLKPANTVWTGTAYDPERGITADVTVSKKGNILSLRGCIRIIFELCETDTWRRP